MTEMREWWANIREDENGEQRPPACYDNRAFCEKAWSTDRLVARIHVRLKPKGAPKRYASEANRRAWEKFPHECRRVMRDYAYRPEDLWL